MSTRPDFPRNWRPARLRHRIWAALRFQRRDFASLRSRLWTPRSLARSPETLHPQSAPAHARGKTHSAAQSRSHAHTNPSDYSDAPRPRPASAPSAPSPATENPFAIRGHKSADTAPVSHLANPPETQTADNSAWAPAAHPRRCRAIETQTNSLRWCWSSGQSAPDRCALPWRPEPLSDPTPGCNTGPPPASPLAILSPADRKRARAPNSGPQESQPSHTAIPRASDSKPSNRAVVFHWPEPPQPLR